VSENEVVEEVVEVEEVEAEATAEEEEEELDPDRKRLLGYSMGDLRKIAEEIGAPSANKKEDLVDNILAKSRGEAEPTEAPQLVASPRDDFPIDPSGQVEVPLVKHLMMTVGLRAEIGRGVHTWDTLNAEIEKWFARGYEPIMFDAVGFLPEGHRLLWVFKKVDEPKFRECHHIIRTLSARPSPEIGSISGFQADLYISSFIQDGWELVGASYNGNADDGIYMAWMLAR